MSRVFILLYDSFGIGASEDAPRYGDEGADTLGHIVETCAQGKADIPNVRSGRLHIPNLISLGIARAALASTGITHADLDHTKTVRAKYGYAVENSLGKDTPSGHWEMAGVPVMFEWGYFPNQKNCFPQKLMDDLIQHANLPGILGEKHASGTEIIEELGKEHQQTGKPIIYTSADSVLQIAAHEDSFGLENLYDLCKIARTLVDEYNIGRVIARPFIGEPGHYKRTANRRDYSQLPPAPTLLDKLKEAGREVITIGKVDDIFAHQGVTQRMKAENNLALFDACLEAQKKAPDGSLVFANFVDFDSKYGHRRDVAGYAHALESLDLRLPEFIAQMQADDIAIITADHGCDPTFDGSDHTREHIPVLAFGPSLSEDHFIGRRSSFADIGQSIAHFLHIAPLEHGINFL